jgi:hypothetical protein
MSALKDGRKANVTNSGIGTIFGVVDGKSLPVWTMPPSGFGYRRCPGEQRPPMRAIAALPSFSVAEASSAIRTTLDLFDADMTI